MQSSITYQERITLVDSLRGYALLGLFHAHAVEFFELYWAHPEKSRVHDVVFGLFEGKSFSLLALCFGLSFFIIMDRSAKKGIDFSGRFIWRLTILFILGWLHGLVYMGEVLQVLAPLGLLLVFFNRIKNNYVLIALAALCFIQPPIIWQIINAAKGVEWANQSPNYLHYNVFDVYMHGSFWDVISFNTYRGQLGKWWFYIESGRIAQIIGLYLVGLVLGRIGFFSEPQKFIRQRRTAMVLLGLTGFMLWFVEAPLAAAIPHLPNQHTASDLFSGLIESLINLTQMGFTVMLFIELYMSWGHKVLRLLAPVGRMTLTLYILQSLVFVPLYYGFGLGLHAVLSQAQALCLGIAFFTLQVVAAHLWFRFFLYGPLEWLWRAATYLTLDVPFLRTHPRPI